MPISSDISPFLRSKPLTDEEQALAEAYSIVGRTLDDLPYTDDFERLVALVQQQIPGLNKADIFWGLSTLRKRGRLPKLGPATSAFVPMSEAEREILQDLLFESLPTLGQRDRLPYSQGFDTVLSQFKRKTGRDLSRHDLWRLIARIAK